LAYFLGAFSIIILVCVDVVGSGGF